MRSLDLKEIKKTLENNFNDTPPDSQERIILFWYDDEGEFSQDIEELELDNAEIFLLKENNSFYLKYHLEKVDTTNNYLIYSPVPKPKPRDNWLLDIVKYSGEFSTDKAAVIMKDLGIKDPSLRPIFKKHIKFFANKERYKKFASYDLSNLNEERFNVAVFSVLKVRSICHGMCFAG